MGLELEKEANRYIEIHKNGIVIATLAQFYEDLDVGCVKLPDFIEKENCLQKATKHVELLKEIDIDRFNSLYEECWNSIKEIMP